MNWPRILLALCMIIGIAAPVATAEDPAAAAEPSDATAENWTRLLGPRFESVGVNIPDSIKFQAAPELVWSIEAAEGYGIGSVADGVYYHFDATLDSDRPDGIQERLRAMDFDSGKPIWVQTQPAVYRDLYGYEPGPRSVPTIADRHIYTMGVSGQLTCRSIDDGAQVWSVDTSKRFSVVKNFFGVGGSPLIVGDQVIVMVGGSPPADSDIAPGRLDRVSPDGSLLVSFDRSTGDVQWQSGDDLASYSSPRTIQIDGKTFVLILGRAAIWMIDPADGSVQWKHDHRAGILESVNAMIPVVNEDQVFVSECYERGSVLLDVSADAAEVLWQDPPRDRRRQSMRCHWSTPVLIDGFLYGCSGRNAPDCDFRCIDWKTGKVKWTGLPRMRTSVTRLGEHLLVWDERARATVLKANSDAMDVVAEWSLDGDNAPRLNYPCWSAPVAIGDRVLLRGDEKVVCLKWADQ